MEQWHRRRLVEGTLVYEQQPGSVRVGSTPEHTVVFSRLTPIEVDWLRSLSDVNPRGFRKPGKRLSQRQVDMLRLIDAAGLLQQRSDPVSKLRVRVSGLDAAGIGVAVLLARIGVSHLDARDRRPVAGECEQLFPFAASGESREAAVRSLVSQISPSTCTGKIASPDVAVVCASRVVDHGVTGRLLSHDVPHVVLTSDDRTVTVGPVVIPGVTACALCADLDTRDRVPGWASLADALRTTPAPRVGIALAQMAAGMAVGFVRELAHGVLPAVVPDAAIPPGGASGLVMPSTMVRLTSSVVTSSSLSPHPECGCTGLGKRALEKATLRQERQAIRFDEPTEECLPRTG